MPQPFESPRFGHSSIDRRTLLVGGLSLLAVRAAHAAPSAATVASAQTRVARLRALSQRIAKGYLQVLLDVDAGEGSATLTTSHRLVRTALDELARTTWPGDTAALLHALRQSFEALDIALVLPPTREQAAVVSARANQALGAANALGEALDKLGRTPTDTVLQTAGRQRMLSQRLAKNYFLAAAGLDTAEVRDQRGSDAAEFKRALATLAQAPVSNGSIRSELAAGEMQWVFYDAALARAPDVRGLRAVGTASERMLEIMDNLVVKFEVALRDAAGN